MVVFFLSSGCGNAKTNINEVHGCYFRVLKNRLAPVGIESSTSYFLFISWSL